jgi:hypothetical protein
MLLDDLSLSHIIIGILAVVLLVRFSSLHWFWFLSVLLFQTLRLCKTTSEHSFFSTDSLKRVTSLTIGVPIEDVDNFFKRKKSKQT